MSEVIEEDMDEEDVKEEFRWWRPRISQKLMVNVKNGLLFQHTNLNMYKLKKLAMKWNQISIYKHLL